MILAKFNVSFITYLSQNGRNNTRLFKFYFNFSTELALKRCVVAHSKSLPSPLVLDLIVKICDAIIGYVLLTESKKVTTH